MKEEKELAWVKGKISLIEVLDKNLIALIEGTEGKLHRIARESKDIYNKIQNVLFDVDDYLTKAKRRLEEILE